MTADALDPERIARDATIHSFLNCYLLETGEGAVIPAADAPVAGEPPTGEVMRVHFESFGATVFAPLSYRSPTGRHQFDLPAVYRPGSDAEPVELDYLTLAVVATRDLAERTDGEAVVDDLVERVIRSCRNVEQYVRARADDRETLYGTDWTFRAAEQSLVFGHHLHPTPKSRRGMERNPETYAPELAGSFPLSYVRADPSVVDQGSVRDRSAAEWVGTALRADPSVPESFVAEHVESEDVLLPVHPWQAEYLRDRPHVRDLRDAGDLAFLGQVGREFAPTASVRTLYSPDAPFMVKGSLAVEITNSVRTNKRPELERGLAIADLLDTAVGQELAERFPAFDVVRDPAYLTIDAAGGGDGEGDESGFEVVLRENPFRGPAARRATPVVALCQDGISTQRSRLARVVEAIAEREGRSVAAVSADWFERYLAISVRPILWLYLAWGVGLEAHQQNSVLTLDEEGYPAQFRYRDNQGYYFPEDAHDRVASVLPGVGERADTLCPDAVADERVRYYVVCNNACGVINAFGTAGLVDERRLLGLLRDELRALRDYDRPTTSILDPLLSSPTVPRKANLLTRVRGLDELDAPSLDEQSVYADVANPLAAVQEEST